MTILIYILIILAIINIAISVMRFRLSKSKSDSFEAISSKISAIEALTAKLDPVIRSEFGQNRTETQSALQNNRMELATSLKALEDTFSRDIDRFDQRERQTSEMMRTTSIQLRETIEKRLSDMQNANAMAIESIRRTVDEKLEEGLEKRFTASFNLISRRLEEVHRGLGEMHTLAGGIGELKKVLTNVKTRGNFGEVQLGNILEQFLSPEQFIRNAVCKKGSSERVEYAVKLPGQGAGESVLLPIDSKFPNEDYQRLIEALEEEKVGDNIAQEANSMNLSDDTAVQDSAGTIIEYSPSDDKISAARKAFEVSLKKCAKDIHDKYINPPMTTDFAIMFVPTEGLYAEALRRTGLFEYMQRELRVTIVGPTNLVAFLSSLQMGFRTLAIEKRSSEVWEILGAVKTEFNKFGDIIEKTKKKLQEATNVIDSASIRTRAIERKLRDVQSLDIPEEVDEHN